MIYSVKWVKEHLNVTPDMIRRYESEGLMNKDYYQNPITNRREYTQREIDKLWEIKIYLNMGFTLKQIKKIFESSDHDFEMIVEDKLKRLEESNKKTNEAIMFIKAIKHLGRFPTVVNLEETTFKEFKEKLLYEEKDYGRKQD